MPTLDVREVPEDVYREHQARAKKNGRSLNSEALEILNSATMRSRSETPITDRLRELAREIKLPPDAPKQEDVIRAARNAADRGL